MIDLHNKNNNNNITIKKNETVWPDRGGVIYLIESGDVTMIIWLESGVTLLLGRFFTRRIHLQRPVLVSTSSFL